MDDITSYNIAIKESMKIWYVHKNDDDLDGDSDDDDNNDDNYTDNKPSSS